MTTELEVAAFNSEPDYTKTPYKMDSRVSNSFPIGISTTPFCAPPVDFYAEALTPDVAVCNSVEGNGQYLTITAKKAGTATFKIYAQANSANTDTVEYTLTTKDVTVTIEEAPPAVKVDEQGRPAEYYLAQIKLVYDTNNVRPIIAQEIVKSYQINNLKEAK